MARKDQPHPEHFQQAMLHAAQKRISEIPITAMQIGYHVRNQAEIDDIDKAVSQEEQNPLMVALSGSRQAGKIIKSHDKLVKALHYPTPDDEYFPIVERNLSQLLANSHGEDFVDLSSLSPRLPVPIMAGLLIYDIDILVVRRSFNRPKIKISTLCPKSGSNIDLFIISPDTVVMGDRPFFSPIFNRSLRIR